MQSLKPQASSLKVKYNTKRGFNLSELLIALAILGLIATFTIPKVLISMDVAQNKAKFKETYAAISEIYNAKVLAGTLNPALGGSDFFDQLNVVKICANHARNEGCAPTAQLGYPFEYEERGVVLSSGVMVYGLGGGAFSHNAFIVDINGLAQPNTVGQDMMVLAYCNALSNCTSTTHYESGSSPPGKVQPMWGFFDSNAYRDANKVLFLSLFN